jgi:hypothetical protein
VFTLLLDAYDFYQEKSQEFAKENGIENIHDANEQEFNINYAQSMYAVLDEYVKNTVIYMFNVRVSEANNIEGVFLILNNKFINLKNLDDIEFDEWQIIQSESIPICIVLKDPISFNESYLLKLSRGICSFTAIFKLDDKFIAQEYSEGDYNDGYFSDNEDKNYIQAEEDWQWIEYCLTKDLNFST